MGLFSFKIFRRLRKERQPSATTIGKAYDVMEIYFGMAVLINAVPFTYDRIRRRYDVDKCSVKYKIWFVLMFIGMFIEWAQVTRELVRSKFDHTVSRGEWGMIFFVFSSWSFLSTIHYNVYKNTNEIVNHMNQTIRMREYFTDEKLPPTKDHRLAKLHIYATAFQVFFQCLMVAVEGTKKQYLYSNVPPAYRSIVTSGMWAIWAYYRVMTNLLAAYFLIFGGLFHVSTCNQVIEYKEQASVPAEEKPHIYRMLQVMTSRYAEAHSMIFIPQMTLFIAQNLTLGIYGTVKFYDQIDFANYMNFPLMSVLVIVMAGTFYTKNATVYEKTKNEAREIMRGVLPPLAVQPEHEGPSTSGVQTRRSPKAVRNPAGGWFCNPDALKEARRVARACPVVAVTFGSLYPIKRTTVMNLFNFIACNAISTLITYP